MSLIVHGGPGQFILVVVRGQTGSLNAASLAAQERWDGLPGLLHATMHSGFGGDELIELLIGDSALTPDAVLAVYGDLAACATLLTSSSAYLTPGPNQPAGDFALHINAPSSQPVLVSIMRCASDCQQDLFDYLTASAERFRSELAGWVGAALFKADDGCAVFEYLQFASFEAMTALQDLAVIDQHKANLLAFGMMTGSVVMPVATWSSTATT